MPLGFLGGAQDGPLAFFTGPSGAAERPRATK